MDSITNTLIHTTMKKALFIPLCLLFMALVGCKEERPIAKFEYKVKGRTVMFTNYSTNAVIKLWDFGDGTTSDEVSPTHTYAESGSYTVTLKVYSADMLSDSHIQIVNIETDTEEGKDDDKQSFKPTRLQLNSYTVHDILPPSDDMSYDDWGGAPDIYMFISYTPDGKTPIKFEGECVMDVEDFPVTIKQNYMFKDLRESYYIWLMDDDPEKETDDIIMGTEFIPYDYIETMPTDITFAIQKYYKFTLHVTWLE